MKRVAKLSVGLLISAVALYIAFKDIDISKVWAIMRELTLWPVFVAVLLGIIHFIVRSIRWRYLLPDVHTGRPTVRQLLDALLIGNFTSFVLPLRAGEFIRPLVISRWSSHSFSTAFASVVVERFFDLSAVLLTFALVAPFLPSLPHEAVLAAYSLGVLALCLLGFLASGCLFPHFIQRVVATMLSPLPGEIGSPVSKFVGDLVAAAAVVKTPSRLVVILGVTGLLWVIAYLQFYAFLLMFPGSPSFLLSATVGVFVALAIALPSAPGFVGVFQVGCVGACALFGYAPEVSQAFSLVAHAVTYGLSILLGFWALAAHGLHLAQLRKPLEEN